MYYFTQYNLGPGDCRNQVNRLGRHRIMKVVKNNVKNPFIGK